MPLLNGIDVAVQIKNSLPETKLIFVTMHTSPSYPEDDLNAGWTGYVLKSSAHEELLKAAQIVLDGGIYISQSLQANRKSPPSPRGAPDTVQW